MAEGALYLTEADVVSLVDLTDAIDAVEDACARQGRRETLEIPKALGTFADGSMHSLGSAFPDGAIGGFKNWINTKRGAAAVMTVFDVEQGSLSAIVGSGRARAIAHRCQRRCCRPVAGAGGRLRHGADWYWAAGHIAGRLRSRSSPLETPARVQPDPG